ncbi:MAG: excinuclease ABC subunit UvrC [Bdellovibrionales bacterium]
MTPSATKLETGVAVIKNTVATLPLSPGVYRMLDAAGNVLYVGKAKALKKRVANYTQAARNPIRIQRMIAETARMEIVTTHTEVEALLLESNLIKELKPRFNVNLRDDKMFPYIALSKATDKLPPRLYKYRGALHRKEADYYGPYASAGAVIDAMLDLQRAFKLRTCSDNVYKNRSRPCLQYHIKRCSAPCVNFVTPDEYEAQVKEAKQFLSGRSRDLQDRYAEKMNAASARKDYEEAAIYRDRIQALNAVQTEQDINILHLGDADVVGIAQQGGQIGIQVFFFRGGRNFGTRSYFPQHDVEAAVADVVPAFLMQFYLDHHVPPLVLLSESVPEMKLMEEGLTEHAHHKVHIGVPERGDKRRLVEHAAANAAAALARRMAERNSQTEILQAMAERFDLPAPPQRIEVYDNSHIQGAHAVGGMIVAGPEGLRKNAYRKFNIKEAGPGFGGDDFGMMREVLTRRFAKAQPGDDDFPDVIIIDGGLGQLNAALEVLGTIGLHNLPVIAIAKGPDRNAGREDFYLKDQTPFKLAPQDPLLYYLQRLRDEAHRFAIGTHRAKRAKAISSNPLADIPGIGATRKKALLTHFGSARDVAGAGISDLAKVPGISYELAEKIYGFFHETE